jgi:hypothetical protein
MIAKVRKGQDFGKLFSYLYRESIVEQHSNPHVVGGNVIGDDPQTLAEDFRAFAAASRRTQTPVFHVSLRLPAGEQLADDQWKQAALTFLKQMKFIGEDSDGFNSTDVPWVAIRHADDHIHVVACRVRFDASTVNVWHDYKRSHQAARAVEQQLGLSSPAPSADLLATVTKGERQSAARRQAVPERTLLQERITHSRDHCDGTRKGFEAKLTELGVKFKANQASTGKMNGYSFSVQGWRDAAGEQVWLQSSKIHKQLRWSQLEADLQQRRQELKAQTPWYKKPAAPAPAPYNGDYRAWGSWQTYSVDQNRKLRRLQQAQELKASSQNAYRLVALSYPGSLEEAMTAARAANSAKQLNPYSIEEMLAASQRADNPWQPESRKPYPPPPAPGRGRGR